MNKEENKRIQLTNDQARLLISLQNHNRANIIGGAGTGKTVLAKKLTEDFNSQEKRTALICFNRSLGDILNLDFENRENIYAGAYHNFFMNLLGIKIGNDNDPFLRTMIKQTGFDAQFLEFDWQKRIGGKSKVNFFKNFDIAINAFISVSKRPTRFLTISGLTISLVSLIYGTTSLILALINPSQADPGIPTLIVFLFFFSGIQFLVLGILGEYIFSIYRHVRPEIPHTIVEKINF